MSEVGVQNTAVEPYVIFESDMDIITFPWVNSSPPSGPYMSVNQVSFGSNNGLSPIRRQAIIWTNTRVLPTGPLGTLMKI